MNGSPLKLKRLFLPLGCVVFCTTLMTAPVTHAQENQQTAPDNTKRNQEQKSPNADEQKMNPEDRATAQKIRKAVVDDKGLSTYAHNVKIICQDGKVTLRGPVRSEDEKSNVYAKAVTVAGDGNVSNQLEVAPLK